MLGHYQQDFGIGTSLSDISFYVIVVLRRFQTLYPISPLSILAQPVQYGKQGS
jgi:hypothetical protein